MNYKFSVIIPLYNKELEVEQTIRSVLAQSYQPLEIVVVNDGSTDRSAEIVRSINSPLIKIIDQPNAGECAARNTAIANASGDYMALIDADDLWNPQFLSEIASLITDYPDCGIYSTAFNIIGFDGSFPSDSPSRRGVVEDFFETSLHQYVTIPSASVITKNAIDSVGGFPEGMKMGGDQYTWIKIARKYKVCFSPLRLCDYYKVASNRSGAIFKPETTPHSFEKLYDPTAPLAQREYIARVALGKALVVSMRGGTENARHTIETFGWTKANRRALRKLRVVNSLPVSWRTPLINAYNYAAWKIARKGL